MQIRVYFKSSPLAIIYLSLSLTFPNPLGWLLLLLLLLW
jgi:hypothetical protein